MPRPMEVDDLRQPAVLWALTGRDRFGKPKVAAAVKILVRWVWKRTDATGDDGSTIALDAQVTADQVIPVGSLMWEGELEDWDDSTKGDVMRVVTESYTPDVKARSYAYGYGLAKYGESLPAGM